MRAARLAAVPHPAAPLAAPRALSVAVPSIVHGEVTHRRSRPAQHAFTYPAFCMRLPLSQLATLEKRGIAHNRRGVVSFHDRDHGPCDGSPLLPWIRELLAAEGVAADGEIVLHAFPRLLGYVFNPVSFWVCHDRAGGVRAVLCEVRNTFGERHLYLLASADGARAPGAGRRWRRARSSTFRRSATSRAGTLSASISAPSAGSRASTITTRTAWSRCSRPGFPDERRPSRRQQRTVSPGAIGCSPSASSRASIGRRSSCG